jgi:hypothetical protein
MFTVVLPLQMIAFQSMFLLIAIAIEAYVLQQNLRIPPLKSVQYATSINYLSAVVGWLIFLNIRSILPVDLRIELMNVIFFDRWSREIMVWVILGALVTFFVSFFVKLFGLRQLQLFLGDQQMDEAEEDRKVKYGLTHRKPRGYRGSNPQANAVLLGNALSYSAISIVLFLRLLLHGNFNTVIQ